MNTFKFHTDPGHGWLEVPKQMVVELGIAVSRFSYQKVSYPRAREIAYLEEDLDAVRFIVAYKAKYGENAYKVCECHSDKSSPIRNYERYGMG